jgi:hypothetical protein
MITPETTSLAGQHALQDMVEFQMYLVAQPQQTPWPILPRGSKTRYGDRKPYSKVVEWSVANELLNQGFIEATSARTFVVSKCGRQFYEREMKGRIGIDPQRLIPKSPAPSRMRSPSALS